MFFSSSMTSIRWPTITLSSNYTRELTAQITVQELLKPTDIAPHTGRQSAMTNLVTWV